MSESTVPNVKPTTTGMKCPVDQADLVMTERQGIEIDYCPQCRGIWLDRGELDKIVERSMAGEGASRSAQSERNPRPSSDHGYDDDERQRYSGRRRGSWLSEIFD